MGDCISVAVLMPDERNPTLAIGAVLILQQ